MSAIYFSASGYAEVCIPWHGYMLWTLLKENVVFRMQALITVCKLMCYSFLIFINIVSFPLKNYLTSKLFLIYCEVHPFILLSAIIIYTVFHVRETTKISRLYSSINVTSSMYTIVPWNWFSSNLIKNSNFPVHFNSTWDLAKRNQNLM